MVSKFLRDERGAAAVEYGLLIGLIAVAIITATTSLGSALSRIFTGVGTRLGNVANNAGF